MDEKIIVSLTTWEKRMQNIPAVLDTIFAQSMPPNLVVLNLANEEIIPANIQQYINTHPIEVNRVPDTKVFKKLIPTLKKYPNDCVISIDDDWLYPQGMIADFMNIHKQHPNNPISGNRKISQYLNCQMHCGCASLTKASFFGSFLDDIDNDVIKNCPSDDLVYTYFTSKAGFPYVRTTEQYYTNMTPYNVAEPYSPVKSIYPPRTYKYLTERFGPIDNNLIMGYVNDANIAIILSDIYNSLVDKHKKVINSNTYKLALKFQKLLGIIRRR